MVLPIIINSVRTVGPITAAAADLIDTKTAAKILGLRNHHTLEVWRSVKRHPELRYHRVGRTIRYRTADLTAFLDANAVGGGATCCDNGYRGSDRRPGWQK